MKKKSGEVDGDKNEIDKQETSNHLLNQIRKAIKKEMELKK
jgi:hypothetical protein